MTDRAEANLPRAKPAAIYLTALLEGAAVIIVEIAGARALAPFVGTSLQVWTAQITATLLFLALGYALGGMLARHVHRWTVPLLFMLAGLWLALYPILRTPMLKFTAANLGVGSGSFISAVVLFGMPLLMLGAVSPVLIAYLHHSHPGAGAASGRLFFTNTMGGLAGGWITALVLIPHASLRISLIATGVLLLAIAVFWAVIPQSKLAPIAIGCLVAGGAVLVLHRPARVYTYQPGQSFRVLYSQQSGIGLLQVLEYGRYRQLMIDGVNQGNMRVGGGYLPHDYIQDLNLIGHSHRPDAKTALQLGLGAGLLPSAMAKRGMKVTAVEIEPQIADLARAHFDLPASVDVRLSDARAFLRSDNATYDLICLDTFASESTAWHLLTREAMEAIKARLNPGGRLLINTVAYADAKLPGLDGIESAVAAVFPQAIVYRQEPTSREPDELVNVTIVGGEKLEPRMVLPPGEESLVPLAKLIRNSRPAAVRTRVPTDDRNDLDYEQAPLRVRWRLLIWQSLDSNLLWD